MKTASQKAKVLDYLREHGSITPIDALREIGCFRLAARIMELRAIDGLEIETTEERHDGGTHARYVLRQTELAL